MNEKFFELEEEKRLRIINAGMKVFGENSYKRAVTDEIAYQAGISKGLLFYYFKNKKSLYLYLYEYCVNLVGNLITFDGFQEIDDFYELLEFGAAKKVEMIRDYPYIMEFVVRCFYSQEEAVSDDVAKRTSEVMQESIATCFRYIDFSKFKDDVDPMRIFQMLTWMTEGYLYEKRSLGKALDVNELMQEFHAWKVMFKNMTYKEEFL